MSLISIILLIFSQGVSAQTNFNSSLNVKYGDGLIYSNNSWGDNSEEDYNYSQILYDINLYSGPWNINSQIEFSDPPEIGISFKGVRRFTFNYNKKNINIFIGDIYRSWAKGLVLSQYNDIDFGYDNGIKGASIAFNKNKTYLEFLSGNKKLRSFSGSNNFLRIPNKITSNNLIGAHVSKTLGAFEVGFSTITNKEKFALNSFSSDSSLASHNINSINGVYVGENFDFSFEYANKYTIINPSIMEIDFDLETFTSDTTFRKSNYGKGFALSSNYLYSVFSLSIDYAYYAFFVSDPFMRNWEVLPEGISQFQKPMVTSQEYSSILLNRVSHQQNSNDEIGLNLMFNIYIGQNTSLTFNSSFASRTKEWYREKGDSEFITGPWQEQKKDYYFPSFDPSASPYQQSTISYESFFSKGYYHITFSTIDEVNYIYENDVSADERKIRYDLQESFTVPFNLEYAFTKDYSLLLNIGYQSIKKGIQTEYKLSPDSYISYYENEQGESMDMQKTYAVSLGLSKSSKWSFMINIEQDKYNEVSANSDNIFMNPIEKLFDPLFDTLDRTWLSAELTYRFEDNLRLSIFYGSNKGGVSCANGICRYYPGFSDGFRMQMTKSFY